LANSEHATPPASGLLALAHWISQKDDDSNKPAEAQTARSNAIKLIEVVLSSGVRGKTQARESAKTVLAEPLKHVDGDAAKRALELLD
jgi:hypothetical protein